MRALILSDIHGNLEALEAVLAAAQPFDVLWNLGDVIGYGPNPNEVLDRVRSIENSTVRGNHDRAVCGFAELAEFNSIAAQAVLWTQRQLTNPHREWLEKLPQGPLIVQKGIQCVHGSPLDEDEYVVAMSEAADVLTITKCELTFFGHTHIQSGFATNGQDWYQMKPPFVERNAPEHYEMHIRKGVRYLLNPGSVGQPRDKDWRAAFAIYDTEAETITFHRIPYEVGATQEKIMAAGLPERLALRLRQGR